MAAGEGESSVSAARGELGSARIARDYLERLGWTSEEISQVLSGPGGDTETEPETKTESESESESKTKTESETETESETYTTSGTYAAAPDAAWREAEKEQAPSPSSSEADQRAIDIAFWRRALAWADLDPKLRADYADKLRKAGQEI